MSRALILLPTTSYRAPELLFAAEKIGISVTIGAEETNVLTGVNPGGYLAVSFSDSGAALSAVREFHSMNPFDAVVGVDDATALVAAQLAEALHLPGNSPSAVATTLNKRKLRDALAGRLPLAPKHSAYAYIEDPEKIAPRLAYPVVLKPTTLSGSQGVVRADSPGEFIAMWRRVWQIIRSTGACPELLVEEYVSGGEVAVEGLVDNGKLHILTVFDKPDPLEGPYFEESIYVRPTNLTPEVVRRIDECLSSALSMINFRHGPVHAEFRISSSGPVLIEIGPRPIGGRCSRSMHFANGATLEEVVLRHALGQDSLPNEEAIGSSGVMMIPKTESGILLEFSGVREAEKIAGIEEIIITASKGMRMEPLPEGAGYLGFIFARASSRESVVAALRSANEKIEWVVETVPGR